MAKQSPKSNGNGANLGFEEKLWAAADKLRGHMDAAEYKHVVLGLIFLKYISDAFQELHHRLAADKGADAEDRDEYIAENVFWVPQAARWDKPQAAAKQPTIGKLLDDAMVAIEKDNPTLKGVLARDYARPSLDKTRLGELIDLIGTIGLGDAESRSRDVLGRVYEYFLGKFASAEGKGGGEFYTPKSVVKLLVEVIEPYKGRIYDPCCGSAGMFVQSENFVVAHGGRVGDLSIYGQESNNTTWRLCKMNLAIRGIEGNIGPHNADTFHNDLHKDLKADFILANPPFNISDWGGERLREDVRWKFGTPPAGNANFGWVQHMVHHLAPSGIAGFVLANGSMSSNQSGERDIRRQLVEHDLVDCMISLPGQLFYTTQIPVCLWFLARKGKDEAHIAYGFAKHLRDAVPNASFIGFTGTPIEHADKSTPAVFGDYIDIYDIQRAVEDGATVKILYEGRLAKIELQAGERPKIDPDFEDVTEGEEQTVKEKLKSKWARLEAMVGSEKRIKLIAEDVVNHWEKRLDAMDGKAMIVCMSRRICVELYKEIVKLRPAWHSDKDEDGILKIVMTGSASDDTTWQPHVRTKKAREELAKRFKKADDPLKVVIVRDMWLTGFDAPSMHTMYLDKPMRGHGLMQAIARVNRVFRDKPGGLVVDYLGLAAELKKALAEYTEQDRDYVGIPTEEAVDVLMEKYEVVAAMFHGFDYTAFFTGKPSQRLTVLANATDFILTPQSEKESADDRKQRFMQAATELSKAFALVATEDKASEIREEIAFFQCIRAQLAKLAGTGHDGKGADDLDHAVRQIISRAVASDQVIDTFAAAGMQQPNIAILSDEFLAEVKGMKQKNLALEMLKKLLGDEIKTRAKKNLTQSRSFAEMLEKSIRAYQNRSIDAAQVIARLVELAKDMRAAHKRGEDLGMSDDELAFYDALEANDSAVKVLGEPTLRQIARDLVGGVRKNVTIDWTVKESVRAKLRVMVKRILKKYGYPPDKQEEATQTVLKQAELLCADWAA